MMMMMISTVCRGQTDHRNFHRGHRRRSADSAAHSNRRQQTGLSRTRWKMDFDWQGISLKDI
ncbi:hypothetical protein INR49_004989 [Caranx melampygus]|nr:hypothetical protein INR49_004989 [Caranx melampygus]